MIEKRIKYGILDSVCRRFPIPKSEVREINASRMESYLHKSIPKVNTISEIRARKVPVQGSRIELGQHENLVYSTVDAVAHWDVYKPVAPSEWYLQNTMSCVFKSQNFIIVTRNLL